MSSHTAVRFNDPPVTQYNSMDVDESFASQASLDELYFGPEDEIADQSPLAQSNHLGLEIDPALYLRPEDDLIDVNELPDFSDVKTDAPGLAEELMISNEPSTELHSDQPELSYEDLLSMVWDFWPWGSYEHNGLQSIQDRLNNYIRYHGNHPDPSIQQLLEAE
ncbi:hypothetical protein EV702DRAFT_1202249 [Suillus placidus]|uniref:Uncharacterized protein n=1 Tax=Suillus placidus TaxID=48579 RepID=A0A9P7CYJ4_9AGAM|nr:hypothetical protein EV702DRAFT_1202249 [Suillus placidus]